MKTPFRIIENERGDHDRKRRPVCRAASPARASKFHLEPLEPRLLLQSNQLHPLKLKWDGGFRVARLVGFASFRLEYRHNNDTSKPIRNVAGAGGKTPSRPLTAPRLPRMLNQMRTASFGRPHVEVHPSRLCAAACVAAAGRDWLPYKRTKP
jgi:hypothetical protein